MIVARILNSGIVRKLAAVGAVIGGAVATGLGLKKWHDKREQRKADYPGEQTATADALVQEMDMKQARMAQMAQARADAIGSNQAATGGHAAKVAADTAQSRTASAAVS